ncbi:MAG: DUF5017 domain-containing protein, partial [Chlorobi bacterium]|nr:DUF5017 domain-containing protein [Chlorobiota bacterium]
MKKNIHIFFLFFFLLVKLTGYSQVPDDYYDSADGLTGDDLKQELHDIITDGHDPISYDDLWTAFQSTDVDNYYEDDGSVMDMYSENPSGSDSYNYEYTSDQCGTYQNEGDCYNREHSFPKSWWGSSESEPQYSDLNHIFPTDGYVNNRRSSYPFGVVGGTADWVSDNGCRLGANTYGSDYSGTVFEPLDEFKGDFARAYFYMATRYKDEIPTWVSDNSGSGIEIVFQADGSFQPWYYDMLYEWHENDPVSQKEKDRDDEVYYWQSNANPYITHPEWVCEVFGTCTVNPEPDNYPADFTATAVSSSQIDLSWTDATGTNLPDYYLIKANTTGSFTDPVDGTDPAADSDLSDGEALIKIPQGSKGAASFTGLSASTTYYFKIWSYANTGTDIDFKTDGTAPEVNATTNDKASETTLIDEDFSNCPPTGWIQYSVSGDEVWGCDNGYEEINAYGDNEADNDWLITPSMDFSNLSNGVLTFSAYTKYSDSGVDDPEVRVKYSTDYPGSGNPEDYTWTELSYSYPAEDSQTWTSSGSVDLSSITGSSVYIAFQYTSSGTSGGNAALWEIDDVLITAETSGPSLASDPASLSGFSYIEGNGPSASQTFDLSGSDLDGSDVTLTAPSNFEISSDDASYSGSITLS